MNAHDIDIRLAAARRAGNWIEVRRLEDLARQAHQARRQNRKQARRATQHGSFHENQHGFNASFETRS